MDEIKKVKRTIAKAMDGAPHETLLVIDATTGQNALTQAVLFKEALDLTGLILTKLDGTAKGGIVLGVCDELKVPVRYIGLGERAEDLREFVPVDFVEALFGRDDDEAAAA
jgi:fused signal recognition particle receptor